MSQSLDTPQKLPSRLAAIVESEVTGGPRDRNPTHRYTFPFQEAHFDVGDSLVEVNGEGVGSVEFFD